MTKIAGIDPAVYDEIFILPGDFTPLADLVVKYPDTFRETVESAQKPRVQVANWYFGPRMGQEYSSLHGTVLNHPRLGTIHGVDMSPIVSVDLRNGIVETRNTMYELAEPNPEYIQWLEYKEATEVLEELELA